MKARRALQALLLCGVVVACLLAPTWAHAADLTVWHAYRGAEEAALREAVDRFAEGRGHRVRLVSVSFGVYDSKLETAIPRGNGPDLFIAAQGNLGKWRRMGLLVPAGDVSGEHRDPAIEALTEGGELWGQPLAFKSLMLIYDPEVIDTPPRTTDELLALSAALTEDGRYGLVYEAGTPFYHAPWMHGFGGAAIDEMGEPTLDTRAQVDALTFAAELAALMPTAPSADRVSSLYTEGRAAMIIDGPWRVADLGRRVAAAPLPLVSPTGEPARPYLTVEAAFVAARGQDPEAAAELASFLSGVDGAQIRQEVGRQAVTASRVVPSDPILQVQLDQAARSEPLPTDPEVQSAWEGLARALRQVLRGTVLPDRAMAAAQQHATVLRRPPPPPANPWPYGIVLALLALAGLGALGYRLRDPDLRRRMLVHAPDYLWIAPAGLAMVVLVVVPFLTGAAVALFAHHQGEWSFVGLAHFIDILLARDWPITSPMSFGFTLVVTVLWTVSNVTLHVVIGVALAMLLREPWVGLRGVWRALLILPWAVPNYITALIWRSLFDAQVGAINAILGLLLLRGEALQIDWFSSFATGFAANLTTNTWLGFPFMMVVTLGALQSIPRDLEEAAEVDGAGAWQRFRHVTWPMLMPALLPAMILGSVWTFNMFNVIYLVSAGEPDGSTEILISEAYRWAFSRGNRYGYAAAYAVLIFLVLLFYSRLANRLAGRKVL
ncbi:MAG: extracellular solute-binding protein [Deltaproteobacteria bacterium]|nr:MAG: extracellular solute-binding protein [Deltaproteobacteria bacterium]